MQSYTVSLAIYHFIKRLSSGNVIVCVYSLSVSAVRALCESGPGVVC